ncbi:ABC transporter permease [Stygiolobus azoricus]|uniref:ABC transporter permease subunit n=1 Tax=Stygiolobus azoricus TaxID=41675 RepID=A0A650CRY3_9CREN|nr:ABC transporter permease [Stygiolobus azoricus]QGR20412.1 ABC transporter permease subunit [Stygiolobus azoricus]
MRIPTLLRLKTMIIALVILAVLLGSVIGGYLIIPEANPYTPAGQDAAAPYAVPYWASIFYGNLPPNIDIPPTYDLIAAKSPNVINYWHLTNFTYNGDKVTVIWNDSFGPTGESNFEKTLSTYGNTGNGSIEIIITGPNPLNLTLYHTFDYTYLPPGGFNTFQMQASIYYTSSNAFFVFNGYLINPKNESFWMFASGNTIPTNYITISPVFKYIGAGTWNYIISSSGSASTTPWFYTSNISVAQAALAYNILLHEAFNTTGTYIVEYQINYIPNGGDSKLTIYLSDLFFKFLGSRYGLLGTDNNGASVYAEYVQGGLFDLGLALVVGLAIVGVGAVVGLLAGYYGGKLDQILISISDFILLIPGLALLIILITIFQQIFLGANKVLLIIIVLVILSWPPTARIIRGQTLAVRSMPFIEAARALGMSNMQILRKHVIRHVMPIIIAQLIFDIPAVIGIESALDFLGIGIITFPTWGNMLGFSANAALSAPSFAWWWILPPGIALFLLGISLFYVGEAITRYYGSLTGEVH